MGAKLYTIRQQFITSVTMRLCKRENKAASQWIAASLLGMEEGLPFSADRCIISLGNRRGIKQPEERPFCALSWYARECLAPGANKHVRLGGLEKHMSSQDTTPDASSSHNGKGDHDHGRLGFFLCWAVVFADIGTSVYYVPGILYGQVGKLAGFFVVLTLVVFVLLTLKYSEVTYRYPQGGGVVTVSATAMKPWVGAVGGMFILVDYFLTAAISSLSGLIYFSVVAPRIGPVVLPITIVVLALLGVLNWWGISESAIVSAAGGGYRFSERYCHSG